MNNDFQENDALRYFFGELSETELESVEERFFADEEFSEWLDEIETDLIDSYVRRELDAAQKRKFEEKFLVTERRRARVEAAVALQTHEISPAFAPAAVAETEKPSFWESLRGFFTVPNLAYASLGILFLALIGGFLLFSQRSANDFAKTGNENIEIEPTKQPSPTVSPEISPVVSPNDKSNADTPTVKPQKTPSPKPTAEPQNETPKMREAAPVLTQLDLFSSNSRSGGGEANKIVLKNETRSVYLRLRFKSEEEFTRYRIEMRDAGGNLVAIRELQNKKALGLTVSAQKLRKGDYKITLKGAKTVEEFELLDVFDLMVVKK